MSRKRLKPTWHVAPWWQLFAKIPLHIFVLSHLLSLSIHLRLHFAESSTSDLCRERPAHHSMAHLLDHPRLPGQLDDHLRLEPLAAAAPDEGDGAATLLGGGRGSGKSA